MTADRSLMQFLRRLRHRLTHPGGVRAFVRAEIERSYRREQAERVAAQIHDRGSRLDYLARHDDD